MIRRSTAAQVTGGSSYMRVKRAFALILAAATLTVGGLTTTATPAAAAAPCNAATLCLWEKANFVQLSLTSKSTAICVSLTYDSIGSHFVDGIGSYANNLPVKVDVYGVEDLSTRHLVYQGTISPGRFSSSVSNTTFGRQGMACMGGASPYV
ncbi:peptidase inhibitor family I36 protein [Micromonospora sp. MS34]|uniref:peptidase inhibitor family I36 protein n=1 Tax=Micromonospora sp. MS34 TaxID=3385971 RepID=UPI0039A3C49E